MEGRNEVVRGHVGVMRPEPVPGTHRVIFPFMRYQRVRVSSTAVVSAWPRCSEPVTLGGGITMTNLSSGPTEVFVCLASEEENAVSFIRTTCGTYLCLVPPQHPGCRIHTSPTSFAMQLQRTLADMLEEIYPQVFFSLQLLFGPQIFLLLLSLFLASSLFSHQLLVVALQLSLS